MSVIEPVLFCHGGAGPVHPELRDAQRQGCLAAARAGWECLTAGGSALDAVEVAVRVLEDDPVFNAGTGSVLNAEGEVEMDASIMDGASLEAGGVGAVRAIRNPVLLARRVMEDGRHLLLVGIGAERFAEHAGIARCAPGGLTGGRQDPGPGSGAGTVGCVALDREGRSAAATSTGGRPGKLPGRVGDSAVIGAGTYADRHGAVSCTGVGEAILKAGLARSAVDLMARGLHPQRAAEQALAGFVTLTGSEAGLIAVDAQGRLGHAHNAAAMTVAVADAGGRLRAEG